MNLRDSTDSPLCLLYLRKSRRKAELADPDVLARHRSILLHQVAQDGRQVTAVFEEVKSGERIAARPEFQRLLALLEEIPAGVEVKLYLMDVDRLSRGTQRERGLILEALQRAGVILCTPSGVIDPNDTAQSLLFEVKGALARHELQVDKQRMESDRNELTRIVFLATGTPAWGYQWDRNTRQPVPHPERFPILERWCREIHFSSLKRLAREAGVPHDLVWRTLRNPMICGYPARRHRVQYTPEGQRVVVRLPREEWRWPGPDHVPRYPVACTRAEWEAIWEALHARHTLQGKDGFAARGWCRALVRFAGCSLPVRLGCIWRARETYEIDPDRTERHLYIRRDAVHAAVEAFLRQVATHGAHVCRAALESAPGAPVLTERDEREAQRLRSALAGQRQALANLLQRWATADEETQRGLRQAEAAIKREITALKRALTASERQPARNFALERLLPVLPEVLEHWEEYWKTASGESKQRLAEALLVAVEVRVTPAARFKHAKREVVEVVPQPWLAAALAKCPGDGALLVAAISTATRR